MNGVCEAVYLCEIEGLQVMEPDAITAHAVHDCGVILNCVPFAVRSSIDKT